MLVQRNLLAPSEIRKRKHNRTLRTNTRYPEVCMKVPERADFTGPHGRWGRPFSELSTFSIAIAVAIILLALASFVVVRVMMKRG
jgi:hypothetical protein